MDKYQGANQFLGNTVDLTNYSTISNKLVYIFTVSEVKDNGPLIGMQLK